MLHRLLSKCFFSWEQWGFELNSCLLDKSLVPRMTYFSLTHTQQIRVCTGQSAYFAFSCLHPPLGRLPWLLKPRVAQVTGKANRHGLWWPRGQLFLPRGPPTSASNSDCKSTPQQPPCPSLVTHTCLHDFQLATRWRLFYLNLNKWTKNWSQQFVTITQKVNPYCTQGLGPLFIM